MVNHCPITQSDLTQPLKYSSYLLLQTNWLTSPPPPSKPLAKTDYKINLVNQLMELSSLLYIHTAVTTYKPPTLALRVTSH